MRRLGQTGTSFAEMPTCILSSGRTILLEIEFGEESMPRLSFESK